MLAPKQHNSSGHQPQKPKQEKKPFVLQRQGQNAGIQAKLKVGKPNDKFEKEADSVADKVVNHNTEPNVQKGAAPPIQTMKVNSTDLQKMSEPEEDVQMERESDNDSEVQTKSIQRMEMGGDDDSVQMMSEEDSDVQAKSEDDSDVQLMSDDDSDVQMQSEEIETMSASDVQAKSEDDSDVQLMSDDDSDVQAKFKKDRKNKKNKVASNLKSSKGGGSKMDAGTQSQMESGFGTDLGGVNIHTDSKSVEMNQDLGSKAFTNGADIYFNEGQYDPASQEGQTLLAHELTHTLQQGAVEPGKLSRKEKRAARKEEKAEKKADRKTARAEKKAAKQELKIEKEEVKAVATATKAAVKTKKKEDKKKEKEEKKAEKKAKRNPKDDPDFMKVVTSVGVEAKGQQKHEPVTGLVANAQEASPEAQDEHMGNAQAGQVDEMNEEEAKPKEFDAKTFRAMLDKRIAGMQLPETMEEADDFENNNNIDEINDESMGDVSAAADAAAGPVAETSQADPDLDSAEKREPGTLVPLKKGKKPKKVNAETAIPKKRPDSEVNKPIEENTARLDSTMADNDVTDEQLAISQEPSFIEGLDGKNDAKSKAVEAPKALRQQEQTTLNNNAVASKGKSEEELKGMNALRGKNIEKVTGSQKDTGTKDSAERQRIATEINEIYNTTKKDVEKILGDLDVSVEKMMKAATDDAKDAFEDYVRIQTNGYFRRRYGGTWGGAKWLKDKIMGVPDEINKYYKTGREKFVETMDGHLDVIADHVATQLNSAESRVQEGKNQVTKYVDELDPNQKKMAQDVTEEINDKFDQLSDDVNSKQDDLVDSLAESYMESLDEVDARIEEMKEANKGLVDAVMGMINGIIETIRKLKQVITDMLSAIQSVIGTIAEDPIGFMGMLFDGLGKGFDMFKNNIQTHLLGGLLEWLTGSLGPMGIQMPADIFSLSGVFDLSLQVLGLGWDYIKLKAVKMMGEPVVNALMTGFTMFKVFATEGAMGIWKYVKDSFQDIKSMVIDTIKDMLITKVIEAGVKWLLSLLIPGAGFIKAIMAIKDIIVFFVESAIMLIPAITDAILALARGDIAGVAKAMEFGLAKLISLVIGLFARLIGLNGLSKRVGKIFKKIRKRIDKAISKLLRKARKAARKLFRKKRKKGEKTKGEVRSKKEMEADLNKAIAKGEAFASEEENNPKEIQEKLNKLKKDYDLKSLKLVQDKKEGDLTLYHIEGEVNPKGRGNKKIKKKGGSKLVSKSKYWNKAKGDFALKLIGNGELGLTKEEFEAFDKAQELTNNEVRKPTSSYGDGTNAYIAILEYYRAGQGNEPSPIVGNTLHRSKMNNTSRAIDKFIKNNPELLQEAVDNLRSEQAKIIEAESWIDNFEGGGNSSLPSWVKRAKTYKRDF